MRISEELIEFVKQKEGFEPLPKKDPIGLLTVGYGHRVTPDEKARGYIDIHGYHHSLYKPLTEYLADMLLISDLYKARQQVHAALRPPLTKGQEEALISLTFNAGRLDKVAPKAVAAIRRGDMETAAEELFSPDKGVVKAGGKVLPGLVVRRAQERDRFFLR